MSKTTGNKKILDISIIMPVYNSRTIIKQALASIKKQEYPIRELIVVDNHSTDDSVNIVETFSKTYKTKVTIIKRDRTYSVGSSYNLAIKKAKSPYVIVMHSDSILTIRYEVRRLVEPFISDASVVASYPTVEHPKKIWMTYNFWQKCLFANVAGTARPALLGKFDCYKREAFLRIGGFDVKVFINGVGSEDANLHFRFKKIGKVVPTNAQVEHIHYLGKDYSLKNWILNRKLMTRSYAGLMLVNWQDLKGNSLFFLIKPLLVILSFIPNFTLLSLICMSILPLLTMKIMFTEHSTRQDIRILLLPLLSIFLVYYETFWMMEVFIKRSRV